jgi:hypothetical protein
VDKVTAAEIKDLTAYERVREEMRAGIIALKKNRRISVGDSVTLLFENKDTVLFQIQEMVRTERIVDPAKIEEEVATYNGLIPDQGELSATLFIEIPGIATMGHDAQIAAVNRFQGIDKDAVFLVIGGERTTARFEEGRTKEEKMSAVHFLRFPLSPGQIGALARPEEPARIEIEHRNYAAAQDLWPAMRAELAKDLA